MNSKTADRLSKGDIFRAGIVVAVSPPFMDRGSKKVAVTYSYKGTFGDTLSTEYVLALSLWSQS